MFFLSLSTSACSLIVLGKTGNSLDCHIWYKCKTTLHLNMSFHKTIGYQTFYGLSMHGICISVVGCAGWFCLIFFVLFFQSNFGFWAHGNKLTFWTVGQKRSTIQGSRSTGRTLEICHRFHSFLTTLLSDIKLWWWLTTHLHDHFYGIIYQYLAVSDRQDIFFFF